MKMRRHLNSLILLTPDGRYVSDRVDIVLRYPLHPLFHVISEGATTIEVVGPRGTGWRFICTGRPDIYTFMHER